MPYLDNGILNINDLLNIIVFRADTNGYERLNILITCFEKNSLKAEQDNDCIEELVVLTRGYTLNINLMQSLNNVVSWYQKRKSSRENVISNLDTAASFFQRVEVNKVTVLGKRSRSELQCEDSSEESKLQKRDGLGGGSLIHRH